jgi:hypothetical protein
VLKDWLDAKVQGLSDKSDTAGALRYAFNHCEGLTRFLEDERIEIDPNPVERAMRPIKFTAKTPCLP